MKTKKLYVGLAALFFTGSILLTACGGGESPEETTPEETEAATGDGHHHEHGEEGHDHENTNYDDAVGVYVCPMKCEGNKTYAEAGVCPACGMDLVAQNATGNNGNEDAPPAEEGNTEDTPSDDTEG